MVAGGACHSEEKIVLNYSAGASFSECFVCGKWKVFGVQFYAECEIKLQYFECL